MISLDIISDVACPWCYVGKAFLDRALEARPTHPFKIEWHPYQLNPDMPPEGMDRADYMTRKFGTRENILRVYAPLLEQAQKAGIALDLATIRRAPNSLDAHRLIHWAGLEGRQTAMVSTLFRAYWSEGRDIGDRGVLVELAGSAGLDRAMIARLIETDADRDEIAARAAHSRTRGVNAVPTFIVAHRHVVQGAQPADLWMGLIDDLGVQMQDRQA